MFLKSKRTSRSVDYLLAALSPLEVARATHEYLGGLGEDELQALVAHSVARMDEDERAYFEMSPDFGTFLEQNRRALRTLDSNALRAIFMPVIGSGAATVEGTEDDGMHVDDAGEAIRRLTNPAFDAYQRTVTTAARAGRGFRHAFFAADAWLARTYNEMWSSALRAAYATAMAVAIVAAGAAITAILIFFIFPAGKSALAWIASRPTIVATIRAPRVAVQHHVARHIVTHHRAVPAKIIVAQQTAPPPTPRPTATPTLAPTATPKATAAPKATPAPARIASAATSKGPAAAREQEAILRRIASMRRVAGTMPSHEAPLVQRARLIVMSYLDSLMRGDASSALGNLGLSASAGTSNLTEAPILAGATEFRVVRAGLVDAGSAKVQVVIDSPQGRYFGDYIVSANGPAAWITQHEVIPVESGTAHH